MNEDKKNGAPEDELDAYQEKIGQTIDREELKSVLRELRQEEEEDRRYKEQYYGQYPDRLPEREIVHTQTIVQEKRGMGGCLKAFLIFIAIILLYNLANATIGSNDGDNDDHVPITTEASVTQQHSTNNAYVTKLYFDVAQQMNIELTKGKSYSSTINYKAVGELSKSQFTIKSSDPGIVSAKIFAMNDKTVGFSVQAEHVGTATVWITSDNGIASQSLHFTVVNAEDKTTTPPSTSPPETATPVTKPPVTTPPETTRAPETTAPPAPVKPEVSYEVVDSYYYTGTNSIGTDWIKLFIVVENTGTANLYLHDMTVDFEDMSGKFVDNVTMVSACPQVIKPGERAVFYESTSKDTLKLNGKYTMIPHFDIKKATADYVRYETSDVTLQKDDYGGVKVTGRVKNSSSKERSLYVYTLLYDKSGKCIDVLFDITDNINPGEKMGFSMSNRIQYGYAELSEVASYKVYAYHDQWQLFD